jgi:hypothetical protein
MRFIARLLFTFGVAIYIAAPAMACCVTGQHDQPVTTTAAVSSCHDVTETEHSNMETPEVPGCGSCDNCVAVATYAPDLEFAVLSNASDIKFMALASAEPMLVDAKLLVQTTGPPDRRDYTHDTLVSLKQRLTI